MKSLFVLLVLVIFCSCDEHFTEKELYGYYAPVGYKNTFDTIELKPASSYHRKVYDKNGKLVLEMNGKWSFERGNILHFDSYFFNLDRDLEKYPELLADTAGGWGGRIETRKGIIGFCVGYFEDENCYRQVK